MIALKTTTTTKATCHISMLLPVQLFIRMTAYRIPNFYRIRHITQMKVYRIRYYTHLQMKAMTHHFLIISCFTRMKVCRKKFCSRKTRMKRRIHSALRVWSAKTMSQINSIMILGKSKILTGCRQIDIFWPFNIPPFQACVNYFYNFFVVVLGSFFAMYSQSPNTGKQHFIY